MKIFKYKIEFVNQWFKFTLPENFKPLAFQAQPQNIGYVGPLYLWALVDGDKQKEISFIALGTGIEENLENAHYIGTAQNEGFVFHLFWRET